MSPDDQATTRVIGSYLSPYVRKVLVCLELKGVRYQVDPIVPFYGNDEFGRLSPLRRVPVLTDDLVQISDSTVICEYLEERYPQSPVLPRDPAGRARARWLEEYADSELGDVFIWQYFNQLVIQRCVWGEPCDEAVLAKARDEEIPRILDYLEAELPAEGLLFGALGLADIAIGAFFRNLFLARYQLDGERWPRVQRFLRRVHGTAAFRALAAYEELSLRTAPQDQPAVLREAGAPICAESLGIDRPRRGRRQP